MSHCIPDKLDNKITCRAVFLIAGIQTVPLSVTGPCLRDTPTILEALELGCIAHLRLCQKTGISNIGILGFSLLLMSLFKIFSSGLYLFITFLMLDTQQNVRENIDTAANRVDVDHGNMECKL